MTTESSLLAFITIPGPPVTWKSHGGSGRRSFNPRWREKEYFQAKIKEQYSGNLLEEQIAGEFIFFIPIPQSVSKRNRLKMISGETRPKKRGDRSNMLKFTEDCLIGIVVKDDSIFVDGPVRKFYDENPRTVIKIWTV